jgi:hypothetical protein
MNQVERLKLEELESQLKTPLSTEEQTRKKLMVLKQRLQRGGLSRKLPSNRMT